VTSYEVRTRTFSKQFTFRSLVRANGIFKFHEISCLTRCVSLECLVSVFTLEYSDYLHPGNLEQSRNTVALATKINTRSIVISVHGNSRERSDIVSFSICDISTLLAAQRRTASWEFPAEITWVEEPVGLDDMNVNNRTPSRQNRGISRGLVTRSLSRRADVSKLPSVKHRTT